MSSNEGSNLFQLRPLEAGGLCEVALDEMLDGWRNQQLARNLAFSTIEGRERLIRRLVADLNEYPWTWSAAMLDEWLGDRRSVDRHRQSTIRGAAVTVRMFCDYICDPGYGWAEECITRFGTHPVQVCHRWNTAVHVQEADGSPTVRPFTTSELQAFFDCADKRVADARRLGRKGWLTSFRDATLFKIAYAYGLRRREVRMLDVADFSHNPHAPEFGEFGVLSVRYGKAMKGSPPKRRGTLTVFDWSIECLDEWITSYRPLTGATPGSGTQWPSERGGVVAESRMHSQFASLRSEIGLDSRVTFHSFRRSYVTHLIEDGFDPKFVQDQVGHEHASTTSLYTSVSSDFRTTSLRNTLDKMAQQLDPNPPTIGGDQK